MAITQKTPIEKIIAPVNRFIHLEYTSGVILLITVIIAIIWANSSPESYHHVREIKLTAGFGEFILSQPLHIWINDGLMAIFFFVIGLELKREFINGELSSFRKASLPMGAAVVSHFTKYPKLPTSSKGPNPEIMGYMLPPPLDLKSTTQPLTSFLDPSFL